MPKPLHPLQQLLVSLKITQAAFAAMVESRPDHTLGSSALSLMINHGVWPRLGSPAYIKKSMRAALTDCGATPADIDTALDALVMPDNKKSGSLFLSPTTASILEDDAMILRRQVLTSEALRHFKLFRSPFLDEIRKADDVFTTRDINYVRETMWQTATHGDFVAVVGESGAGKTTLLREMRDRVLREKSDSGGEIIIIEPQVIGMGQSDDRGSPLKATDICNSVIRAIAPQERVCRTNEARFNQMRRVLTQSQQAGNRHIIVIEEAHDLPKPTLKQLKRIHELEVGFNRLCGILLIGQPELKTTLTKNIFDVREVVQRLMLVELLPLDRDLEEYVAHKLKGASKQLTDIFEPDAIDALRDRLQVDSGRRDRREWISMVYPLAVNNMATAAMNSAANIGKARVTADVVREL